jgi:polyisoprenoid-binding protein YceI
MAASTWKIDASHSAIHFSVRHMVVAKTRGRFTRFAGQLAFDPADLSSGSVQVTIEPGSLDTADAQRDAHLRSADFLDVEKFPTATFQSTKVQDLGGGKLRIAGDLTIRGVKKPVVLEGTYEGSGKDPWGGERAGFAASASIDRREFGLEWNKALETGGVLVGEKVELTLEVEAVKQAAQQAA